MLGNKIDIKGMVGKKRPTPPFFKQIFSEVCNCLKSIKEPDDIQQTLQNTTNSLKDSIKQLKTLKVDLNDLAWTFRMSKELDEAGENSQLYRLAKHLKENVVDVKKGYQIQVVKVKSRIGIKPVKDAIPEEIDIPNYLSSLQTMLRQVLEPLNIDFEELLTGTKKVELEQFSTTKQEPFARGHGRKDGIWQFMP